MKAKMQFSLFIYLFIYFILFFFYGTTYLRAAAFHFLYPVKTPYKALGKSVIVMCFCMCFRIMCFRFSFLSCYVDQLCFDANEVIRIKPGHKYRPHCEHNSKKTIFIISWIPCLSCY